jgi:hypothetical protein
MEKDDKGPKINANVVVGLLQRERQRLQASEQPAFGAERRRKQQERIREMLLKFSRDIVSGLEDDQIMAISEGRAELRGVTPGPLTYEEYSDD